MLQTGLLTQKFVSQNPLEAGKSDMEVLYLVRAFFHVYRGRGQEEVEVGSTGHQEDWTEPYSGLLSATSLLPQQQ